MGARARERVARANLDDARTDYEDGLDTYLDSTKRFNQAVDDNRTKTSFNDDGQAYIEQWNPDTESWETINDFSSTYDKLDELTKLNWGTMSNWASETGNMIDINEDGDPDNLLEFYTKGLAKEVGLNDADYSKAGNMAAKGLGYNDESAYQGAISSLLEEIQDGVSAQDGLTEDEKDAYERMRAQTVRNTQRSLTRDVDAINADGVTMRYLAAADEARSMIQNADTEYRVAMMEQDFQRKQVNLENKREMYQYLVETGQASKQEYLQGIRADKIEQFRSYSEGMSLLLDQRDSDLRALELHANSLYEQINIEIGISEHAIQQANEIFEQRVSPFREQMTTALSELTALMGNYETKYSEFSAASEARREQRSRRQSRVMNRITGGSMIALGSVLVATGNPVAGVVLATSGATTVASS